MRYNVSKLEPKLKSHQFPGFLNGLPTSVFCITGVRSVVELVAECIISRERDIGMVSNFHIAMEMSFSYGYAGFSLIEFLGPSQRLA